MVEEKPLTLTTPNNLPEITGKIENGEFTLRAGGFRFLTIADGGGHWQLAEPGSLPASGTGLEVEDGHAVIHQA